MAAANVIAPSSYDEDIHVCGRCMAAFNDLDAFVRHKKSRICCREEAFVPPRPQPAKPKPDPVKQVILTHRKEDRTLVIKAVAKGASAHPCRFSACSYSAPSAKHLARHTRTHTGEKPFRCEICDRSFSRKDKMQHHHRSVHTDLRPFGCPFCPYSTAESGSLKKHVRIHSGERPFKCQICPYQAKTSSQMKDHVRTHTGKSPYGCTFAGCTSSFKTSSDVRRHVRTHTREKPHQCPRCPYKSATKSNLGAHLRRKHEPGGVK